MVLRAAIVIGVLCASVAAAQKPELIIQNRRPGEHIAFSPDGRLLATTGDEAKSTILWDATTGRMVRELAPANREVFSRDSIGARISSGELGRLPQRYASVTQLALSPDRRWLAVTANSWRVEIWNLPQLTRATVLDSGSVGFISRMAFSDDGERFVVAGYAIRVFRTTRWTLSETLGDTTRTGYTVRELAFSRDGRLLAARDDGLRVFDVESRRLLWQRGDSPVHAIDEWVANDRTLVVGRSAYADDLFAAPTTSVEVWPLDTGTPHVLVDTLPRRVASLALSRDGREVAVGLLGEAVVGRYRRAYVGKLSVFDIENRKDITPPALAIDEAARGLAYTPDGRFLISIRYEEIPSGRTCAYVACGEDEVTNHRVRVHRLNLRTGVDTKLFLLGEDEMDDGRLSVTVSPRGDRVLVGDVPAQMIDLSAVVRMKQFARNALATRAKPLMEPCGRDAPLTRFIAFSPDGELVARGAERELSVASSTTGARVFSRLLTATPEQIFMRGESLIVDSSQVVILHGRMQPDSSVLLVTCRPGLSGTRVERLDSKTGQRRTLARSDTTIDDAMLIRDRVLARSDDTMTLYDRDGTVLAHLLYGAGAWLVITPDGRYDMSAGGDSLASWRVGTRVVAPSELSSGRRVSGLLQSLLRP